MQLLGVSWTETVIICYSIWHVFDKGYLWLYEQHGKQETVYIDWTIQGCKETRERPQCWLCSWRQCHRSDFQSGGCEEGLLLLAVGYFVLVLMTQEWGEILQYPKVVKAVAQLSCPDGVTGWRWRGFGEADLFPRSSLDRSAQGCRDGLWTLPVPHFLSTQQLILKQVIKAIDKACLALCAAGCLKKWGKTTYFPMSYNVRYKRDLLIFSTSLTSSQMDLKRNFL